MTGEEELTTQMLVKTLLFLPKGRVGFSFEADGLGARVGDDDRWNLKMIMEGPGY